MPFQRPTLTALREQARQDFAARLPGADGLLRQSNIRVLSDVFAGALHLVYGFVDWVSRQVIPDTAESVYLERWARIFAIERRPAARAAGSATASGTVGAAVPLGARLLRADRREYRVTAGTVIGGAGAAAVQVEAVEPGAAGNADPGTVLSFATALPGVDAAAPVAAGGLGAGADAEDDDALRARLLARLAEPPHGGNAADYVAWALQVPGVTRAWVYPGELGLGTVSVRFMMDGVRAADQGIPQPADVAAVAAHVDPLRPVTADVTVVAPVAVPMDVVIDGLDPDTPEVRAAIAAELADLVARDAEPGGTLARSKVWEAVAQAAGERRHVLTAPAADVVRGTGEIAVLGDITYT